MTQDKNFKRLVRARMRETGQTYTAARAELRPPDGDAARSPLQHSPSTSLARKYPAEWDRAHKALMNVVSRYVVDDRLVQFPSRRKARAAVLLYLLPHFRPFVDYPESEVNNILEPIVGDFAFWRRELVAFGYLTRANSIYRVTKVFPYRSSTTAQEVPAWETLWLPGFINGAHQ